MAQQQVNVTLAEVGFNGLNTVDSPITQDYSYASVADNCIIDESGRIAARKAFSQDTVVFPTFPSIPGSDTEELILDYIEAGIIGDTLSVLCSGRYVGFNSAGAEVGADNYFFERVGDELVIVPFPAQADPDKHRFTQIVATDDRFYILCEGNETLVWNGTSIVEISSQPNYVGIKNDPAGPIEAPSFSGAIASNGRIWGFGHDGDDQTVYWSDLLNGASYFQVDATGTSTAGKINILEQWPNGKDSIVGLASHNNRLTIFGRQSIVIYDLGDGSDPANPDSGFGIVDAITNIGCVSRDAITNIGTDILFVDDSGVRSLARTIQEKSAPIGDLTNKVRFDISRSIAQTIDKNRIKLEYNSTENIVVCLFEGFAYCLDMKAFFTGGFAKVTRWTDCFFRDMAYAENAGSPFMFLAGDDSRGILDYFGFLSSNSDPYNVRYFSNNLTFGDSVRTKFVKQIDYTLVSSLVPKTGFAKWQYNDNSVKSRSLFLDAITPSFYGVSEYGVALYGDSVSTTKRYKVNTGGKGESVKIGLEIQIEGNGFSLQEINVQTLVGRIT